MEDKVNSIIQSALSVKRTTMTSNDLNQINVTLLPGEVYPDDQVHIIDMYNDANGFYVSREACCGTHIQNTSDVLDFCLVNYKCMTNECTLMALTGPLCINARIRGKLLLEKLNTLEDLVNSTNSNNIDSEKVRALFRIIFLDSKL